MGVERGPTKIRVWPGRPGLKGYMLGAPVEIDRPTPPRVEIDGVHIPGVSSVQEHVSRGRDKVARSTLTIVIEIPFVQVDWELEPYQEDRG